MRRNFVAHVTNNDGWRLSAIGSVSAFYTREEAQKFLDGWGGFGWIEELREADHAR